MLAAILLAAGESRRFGSPKALADIQGSTALERIVSLYASARIAPTIVLGAHAETIQPRLLKHSFVRIVYNKDHNLGQMSSFLSGLNALDESVHAVFVHPVDAPFVQAETIEALCRDFDGNPAGVLIPSFQGRRGHPPLVSAALFNPLRQWSVSRGLNEFFRAYASETRTVPVPDPGVVRSFNTPEELKKARAADETETEKG